MDGEQVEKKERKSWIPMWVRWTVVGLGIAYFVFKYLILR